MATFSDFVRLLRIRQWVKNTFVLAPLLFAFRFTEVDEVLRAVLAFGIFSFVSSCVYLLNDICDREKDAQHPRKQNRPIASGRVSVRCAYTMAGLIIGTTMVGLWALNSWRVFMVVAVYLAMNALYSFKLKHIALVDVFVIAAGFVLRIYAGAYAIAVPVSKYIFMTTLFLSLFLGFTKRKSELQNLGTDARSVLKYYQPSTLEQYVTISATLTIISYALYSLESSTIQRFGSDRLIYSVVFVIFGIFRYLDRLNHGSNTDDPTENLLQDRPLLLICAGYVLYVVAVCLKWI